MSSIACVIPCYNLGRFLEQAVVSALDQERTFDEIFIIDDGSTDETRMVMARMPEYVTKISTTNQGYARTRNMGLELASSDIITFLDADDWLYSDYARKVMMGFSQSSSIGVVCPQVEADGVTVAGGTWPAPRDDDLKELIATNYVWGSSGIRRQAAIDAGGFQPDLEPAADWGLWIAIRRLGWRIVGLHESLWHWRDRPDGLHMTIDTEAVRGKILALFPETSI